VEKSSLIIKSFSWSALFIVPSTTVKRLYHRSKKFSTGAPVGAAGAIFQGDAQLGEPLPNLIGQGEIFGLASFGAKVNE
jgi:hypothetical protein